MTLSTEAWFKKPVDVAALAIWLYLLGFAVCALYYSRFRVLHLAGLRSQYILVGSQILLVAFVVPAAVFLLLRCLPLRRPAYWALPLVFLVDWLLLVLVESPGVAAAKACVLAVLQGVLFIQKGLSLGVAPTIGVTKLVALLVLTAFYANFIFGLIPYYFGGGKAVQVLVSKDNGLLRAGKLIFEDEDYFYFVTEGDTQAHNDGKKTSKNVAFITRVDKDVTQVVQYTIPSTFDLEAP